MEEVVLVDENDTPLRTGEKIETHRRGLLHRAFSIYAFTAKGELLLQRRADSKYHSGGLWTNTSCGHNRPGEDIEAAAHRRCFEENGFDLPLTKLFTTIYRTPFSNGLTEHEFLHVYGGYFEGDPQLNPSEASEMKAISLDDLKKDIELHPENYTEWFKIMIRDHFENIKSFLTRS